MNHIEHPPEVLLASVEKLHEPALRLLARLYADIICENFLWELIAEIKGVPLVNPYLAGFDPFMP